LKEYQRRWIETVRDFTGLWDRFDTLYLQGITLDEVTEEKEDEFLQFQGAMVEQLVKVDEIDNRRFDVHDLAMAVIHDALSLGHIARQSDFQRRRLHQRWGEAAEALSKLVHFCETYTPKLDKTTRLEQVRRINPFWDPTGGGFQATLVKILIGPVTFFAGMRPGREDKSDWFLFKIVIIPSLLVFLVLAIANLSAVQQMARYFGENTGVLVSDEGGWVPKLVVHLFALLGVAILGFVTALVLIALANLHAAMLHAAFKLFGGQENLAMTRKIAIYGGAPIIAVVTAPYAIVLQIIGAHKTQKIPIVFAVLSWLVGTALFAALVLGALFVVYHFTGQIPEEGRYVEVTALDAKAYEADTASRRARVSPAEVAIGNRFKYEETATLKVGNEDVDFYVVHRDGQKVLLRQRDCAVREFRRSNMAWFLIELTRDKVMFVVNRLGRELGGQAD
jgi:hypothetical protein